MASLFSLTEAIDTNTAVVRMMMQTVGAFAEFAWALIRERTRAGLDAARREGRFSGWRPKLRADQRRDIAKNILSGRRTGAQMALFYGVSPAIVSKNVKEFHDAQPKEENML
jgi:DNA invertase Pin-like site-specific DNA recombinase